MRVTPCSSARRLRASASSAHQSQGLFHVDVLARHDGLAGQGEVGLRRGGDGHGADVVAPEDLVEGDAPLHPGILFLEHVQQGLVLVADELQGPEVVKVADKILAPISRSDDGYVHGHCGLNSMMNMIRYALPAGRRSFSFPRRRPPSAGARHRPTASHSPSRQSSGNLGHSRPGRTRVLVGGAAHDVPPALPLGPGGAVLDHAQHLAARFGHDGFPRGRAARPFISI